MTRYVVEHRSSSKADSPFEECGAVKAMNGASASFDTAEDAWAALDVWGPKAPGVEHRVVEVRETRHVVWRPPVKWVMHQQYASGVVGDGLWECVWVFPDKGAMLVSGDTYRARSAGERNLYKEA